jgi:protein O-mannosyl-transferase
MQTMNNSRTNWGVRLIGFTLCLITLVIYWPVRNFEFVNYDDPLYVTENPAVAGGLTWKGLQWAFFSGDPFAGMPLTTLSYLIDSALFGMSASAFHLTNLLLHLANTVLCFAVLRRLTGALWPSALVAALFAWHPLHVEPVAWISGRKDLVCTFFSLLTLGAYGRYAVIRSSAPGRAIQAGAMKWYGLALALFSCALMGKTTAITLPLVLVLLDFWPLGRVPGFLSGAARAGSEGPQPNTQSFARLLLEKLPFFIIALTAAAVSFRNMDRGGGVVSVGEVPWSCRIGNAAVSYARYLSKTFWPSDLAVYYPYRTWTAWQIFGATVLVAGVTLLVARAARSKTCLAVGWLWFLGTLVPVLGLVQTGSHSMADRYCYLPLLGLFMALVWSAADWGSSRRGAGAALSAASAMLLAGCLVLTSVQLRQWHDSETLFRHALRVSADNYIAHNQLAMALAQQGKVDEAMDHYAATIAIQPGFVQARNNLGAELAKQGKAAEAEDQFVKALRTDPHFTPSHYNLAVLLDRQGKPGRAIVSYQLGVILAGRRQTAEAIAHYREAVRLQPNWLEALNNLAWLLATQPGDKLRNGAEAVRLASYAVELTRTNHPGALDTLAAAYAEAGRFDEAVRTAQLAEGLASPAAPKDLTAQIHSRLELYRARQPARE